MFIARYFFEKFFSLSLLNATTPMIEGVKKIPYLKSHNGAVLKTPPARNKKRA